jgi:hypothetical protein
MYCVLFIVCIIKTGIAVKGLSYGRSFAEYGSR